MYAISRQVAAKNAGRWVVHFKRRGVRHYRCFYDASLGGKAAALRAAMGWRDEELAQSSVLTMPEFHSQLRSNNTSGAPGVHFVRREKQPLGAWQAKIKLPDGRKITKSYSVQRYGERKAFDLATKERARMLGMIESRLYLKSRTAKRLATRMP